MSTDVKAIGEALESLSLPKELNQLNQFGKALKDNPEKYTDLRNALLSSATDEERLAVLKGFAISEDSLRQLIPQKPGVNAFPWTITITITITWPGTAH